MYQTEGLKMGDWDLTMHLTEVPMTDYRRWSSCWIEGTEDGQLLMVHVLTEGISDGDDAEIDLLDRESDDGLLGLVHVLDGRDR